MKKKRNEIGQVFGSIQNNMVKQILYCLLAFVLDNLFLLMLMTKNSKCIDIVLVCYLPMQPVLLGLGYYANRKAGDFRYFNYLFWPIQALIYSVVFYFWIIFSLDGSSWRLFG